MKSPKRNFEELIQYYDNSGIRSLVSLIPYAGGIVDIQIMETIQRIRKDRAKTFFDELAKGNIELDDETINSEPFLHSYFSTFKSVMETARREKIALIARYFNYHVKTNSFKDTDEYEFFFKILDDLTYQELDLLMILANFEKEHPIEGDNLNDRLAANKVFWKEFSSKIIQEHDLKNEDELNGVLIRITRSGCLHYPMRTARDLSPISAATTSLFSNLLERIIN